MKNQANPQDPRVVLSVLWVFFLLNIIFRDIHQFLSPGYMDWVLAGEMFGREVTDELLLYGGIAVEVMILMVIAPHFLAPRVLRFANSLAVVFTTALILFTPPIDPDDVFFLTIGLLTLGVILWFGWTRFSPTALANGRRALTQA